MTAVLILVASVVAALLLVLLLSWGYRTSAAKRRQQQVVAAQLATQARLGFLTQQTLAAMRDAVRQDRRDRSGGGLW